MIKLPEPMYANVGGEHLYTEAQLKQAVSDAYYEAAKVCENESCSCCWDESATEMAAHLHTAIRALIKGIDA